MLQIIAGSLIMLIGVLIGYALGVANNDYYNRKEDQ